MKTRGRPNYRPPRRGKSFKAQQANPKLDRKDWYPENWAQLSEEVKREANWTCQAHKLFGGRPCGVYAPPPFSSLLHAHHIVPLPRGTNKKKNLICLCVECHAKAHNHKKGMGASKKQELLLSKLGKK